MQSCIACIQIYHSLQVEDTVIMYPDDFDEPDFQLAENDKFEYRQYMIAKGYSSYWKDNKYTEEN